MELEKKAFRCDRCGRVHERTENVDLLENLFHKMKVYFGYNSPFDDEILTFQICELCLFEFLRGFKHRPVMFDKDIVESFDVFRKEEQPYFKDAFIDTYNRLEDLEKK